MYYKFNKETLLFEKIKTLNVIILGFGALMGLYLILGFTSNNKKNIEYSLQEEKLILIKDNNKFSETKLIEKINQLNFKFPYIILAQAKLESGNFKSNVFLENNNMFGMKEAKLRANLAKGTNRSHAYYENWQDCVLDYALYYSTYLYKLRTEREYFEYLRQNYAEDPTYIQRLKNIIKKQNLKSKF